jgi:hypothetical protein
MSHRVAPGIFLLLLVSCLGGAPPPGAAAPSSTTTASSSGACSQFKIQSSSELDRCKNKCRDDERDQMKSCSGPGCQGGAATAGCITKCDDGQKAAQQAKCYKDE